MDFEGRLAPPDENGCRVWTGPRRVDGYGWAVHEGRTQLAHRVAWKRAHGSIPVGLCVLHRCDNPPCCTIEHLFLGTQRENIADMVTKGRSARQVGERNGRAKLTSVQVAEIRASTDIHRVLSERYGVSRALISMIRTRKVWVE